MKNSFVKHLIFAFILMILVYCCTVFIMFGGIYFRILFIPQAYLMISQVRIAKFIAILAGILFLLLIWFLRSAKRNLFDPILGIFSFIFPLVGIILGIVYRARTQKDIAASNMYLILAGISILLSIILAFFIIFLR